MDARKIRFTAPTERYIKPMRLSDVPELPVGASSSVPPIGNSPDDSNTLLSTSHSTDLTSLLPAHHCPESLES